MRKMILACLCFLTCLFGGCAKEETYSVDYQGMKDSYTGAKDSYKAGENVTLYYQDIAPSVGYSFYLDSEPLAYTWDGAKGFVLNFTMPAHNVTLTCRAVSGEEMSEGTADLIPDHVTIGCSSLTNDGTGFSGRYYRVYESDGETLMEVETVGEGAEIYTVSSKIFSDCHDLIDENKIDTWMTAYEEKEYRKAGGYEYFSIEYDEGDTSVYADVSRMPEDGLKIFSSFVDILENYRKKGTVRE